MVRAACSRHSRRSSVFILPSRPSALASSMSSHQVADMFTARGREAVDAEIIRKIAVQSQFMGGVQLQLIEERPDVAEDSALIILHAGRGR